MKTDNESFDDMCDRIQASIHGLTDEREQWLKQRERQPTLAQIMAAIQALMSEVIQIRASGGEVA